MQKHKNLSFFQKIILSITDLRMYLYVLRTEKLSKSFMHFVGFLAILVLIITAKYTSIFYNLGKEFLYSYDEIVPEFTIDSGELSVEKSGIIKLSNDTLMILDTTYNFDGLYNNVTDEPEVIKYDNKIFVSSDGITHVDKNNIGMQILFNNVKDSYDKASVKNILESIYSSTGSKLIIFAIMFISLFISYLFAKLLEVLLYAVFLSVIILFYGIKLEFKSYFKIALYIITLPYIIETIAITYLGYLPEYAVLASGALAYVYLFRVARAIKIDAFMIIANNIKNSGKNMDINDVNVDSLIQKMNEKINEEFDDDKKRNFNEEEPKTSEKNSEDEKSNSGEENRK